jgi:hypothetical protein
MTRLEALKAAEEFLDGLAPKTNSRGYADGALTGPARVSEVLRVAMFLLAADPVEP